MLALNHSMNSHLFVDTVQVFLTYISDLNYFTRVDLFCWIYSGSNSLLLRLRTILLFHDVRCKLGFTNFTVLAFTKNIVHKDNKSIHFADLRLASLTTASHVDSSRWLMLLWSWSTNSLSFTLCCLSVCRRPCIPLSTLCGLLFYHNM